MEMMDLEMGDAMEGVEATTTTTTTMMMMIAEDEDDDGDSVPFRGTKRLCVGDGPQGDAQRPRLSPEEFALASGLHTVQSFETMATDVRISAFGLVANGLRWVLSLPDVIWRPLKPREEDARCNYLHIEFATTAEMRTLVPFAQSLHRLAPDMSEYETYMDTLRYLIGITAMYDLVNKKELQPLRDRYLMTDRQINGARAIGLHPRAMAIYMNRPDIYRGLPEPYRRIAYYAYQFGLGLPPERIYKLLPSLYDEVKRTHAARETARRDAARPSADPNTEHSAATHKWPMIPLEKAVLLARREAAGATLPVDLSSSSFMMDWEAIPHVWRLGQWRISDTLEPGFRFL